MAAEFDRCKHEAESYCFVVTDSSVRNCFTVMYLLVERLRACKDVVHAWNAFRVEVSGNTGVSDVVILPMIEKRVLDF
jgi:hypothetical protein